MFTSSSFKEIVQCLFIPIVQEALVPMKFYFCVSGLTNVKFARSCTKLLHHKGKFDQDAITIVIAQLNRI